MGCCFSFPYLREPAFSLFAHILSGEKAPLVRNDGDEERKRKEDEGESGGWQHRHSDRYRWLESMKLGPQEIGPRLDLGM